MTIEYPGLLKLSTGDWVDPKEVEGVLYLASVQAEDGTARPYVARIGFKSGRSLTYCKPLMSDAVLLRDKLAAEIQAGLARPTTVTLPS